MFWTKRVLLFVALGSSVIAAPTPELRARDRMVIMISLDGFPAHYLADPKLPAPTLRELMASGASAKEMMPINPSWTWPNHTTLVTGLKAPDHGLLYNGELVREDHPLATRIDPSIPKIQMAYCAEIRMRSTHDGFS